MEESPFAFTNSFSGGYSGNTAGSGSAGNADINGTGNSNHFHDASLFESFQRPLSPSSSVFSAVVGESRRSSSSSSSSASAASSNVPCRFYLAGKCSQGTRCAFSHISNDSQPELCKFFLAGHCKFGSNCALKHQKETGTCDPSARFDDTNDFSFVMNGLGRLGFAAAEQPRSQRHQTVANSQRDRNGSKSSLLPSFLVDELFLDDQGEEADDFVQGCDISGSVASIAGSSPLTIPRGVSSPAASPLSTSPSPVVLPDRPASLAYSAPPSPSTLPSVQSSKPATIAANPLSYGQAILSGASAQPSQVSQASQVTQVSQAYSAALNDFDCQAQQQSSPFLNSELCAFSIMGKCRYGDYCRNIHGLQCPRCLLYVLHPTDMERNEEHIYQCFEREASMPMAELHQIKCGLCQQPVLQRIDPRFGLLNCSHPYCLACIRSWRSAHFDANNEESCSCPECDEITYFIVPSSTWIEDPVEKIKVIEQYKKKMSVIPCKYFDYGRGECPFGTSCFYEHRFDSSAGGEGLSPNNNNYSYPYYRQAAQPPPQHVIEHSERLAKVRESKLSDYIVFKTVPSLNKKK
jgi:hypothetical protein